MSRTFFQRIHQQRRQADLSQIARVVRDNVVEALTVGVLAEIFVRPLIAIGIIVPPAVVSFDDIPVVNFSESPVIGVVAAAEVMVSIFDTLSLVATPTVNDIAVDVIVPESPTIGVVAVIVSVV